MVLLPVVWKAETALMHDEANSSLAARGGVMNSGINSLGYFYR